MHPVLSVIVPVFNEQEVLPETHKRLTGVLRALGEPYEIIYVDDGSRDRSAALVTEFCQADPNARLISFSRNFGQQAANSAGLAHASGDAVVFIDADLQDPPEVIPAMLEKWREGYEVVYGKRASRAGETVLKKLTSAMYYRFLKLMSNTDIPLDTGDFRLMDRKVVDALKGMNERNLYMRGLVSWVGFRQTGVEFEREARFAGETKYSLRKMLQLAINGITAFSNQPLKLATFMGALFLLVGVCCGLFTLIRAPQQGSGGVITVIFLTQGVVLMILGLIGAYIGRIYEESKGRPKYIVRLLRNFDQPDD